VISEATVFKNVDNDIVPTDAFDMWSFNKKESFADDLLSKAKAAKLRFNHDTGKTSHVGIQPVGVFISVDASKKWIDKVPYLIVQPGVIVTDKSNVIGNFPAFAGGRRNSLNVAEVDKMLILGPFTLDNFSDHGRNK
jgi:hypothetical protein